MNIGLPEGFLHELLCSPSFGVIALFFIPYLGLGRLKSWSIAAVPSGYMALELGTSYFSPPCSPARG